MEWAGVVGSSGMGCLRHSMPGMGIVFVVHHCIEWKQQQRLADSPLARHGEFLTQQFIMRREGVGGMRIRSVGWAITFSSCPSLIMHCIKAARSM